VDYKKTDVVWISPLTDFSICEMDEVHWFINARIGYEYGVNVYISTQISRFPRQIVSFNVDYSIKTSNLQQMVDSVPQFAKYYTDGFVGYLAVDFLGIHKRNIHDKSDTYNVESINSDLRHHLSGLRRRSKCFFRKIENFIAALFVFINAYNKFGEAKMLYRLKRPNIGRELPFSVLDFL